MRDIGTRIQRYRLGRYAAPEDRLRRGLRWVWVVGALWLAWVGALSEHSFWRLWQLSRERHRSEADVRRLEAQVSDLDTRLRDPAALRRLSEHALRERAGMARKDEIVYRIGSAKPAP